MPSRLKQEAAVKDAHLHCMKDKYVPVSRSEQKDMLLSRRALYPWSMASQTTLPSLCHAPGKTNNNEMLPLEILPA
jgi:hypothetical protein